jgi:dTMP kinase
MIPNPYPGCFIVFEGIDGCGKTEQLQRVTAWLRKLTGQKTVIETTKEPGKERFFGSKIYQDLHTPGGLHKTDPFRFQMWYACDSKEHLVKKVIPALQIENIVLSDRYRPSMVYGARTPEDINRLMQMNQMILGEHFIWPDKILIFEISVPTAIERLSKKGKIFDGHERRQVLEPVSWMYREFALKYSNCQLIDAERPADAVFEKVKAALSPTLDSPE